MIVNKGVAQVASVLSGETWQIAIGTGTTSPWVENETLQSEYTREDATTSLETTTLANDTVLFKASFTLAETKTLAEFGVFRKSNGIMLCRQVVPSFELDAGCTLEVRVHLQIKRV